MIEPVAQYSDLAGRTVFISGGATGIGRGLVAAFHQQGAEVAFVDINEQAGKELAHELGDRVAFTPCDVTDDASLAAALARAEAGDGIEVLVNNAANDTRHRFAEVDVDFWDAAVAVNLRHQFFAARAVAEGMRSRGRGSIINFGSVAPTLKVADLSVYNTCKAAVRGLTRSLSRELGPHGIRVNSIIPGSILTPRQKALWFTDDDAIGRVLDKQSIKRELNEDDVAQMALFLGSDVSSACTGQEFTVDGGLI
ncbi:MAG: SDR family oxidoreductase [Actinomycetia bacterium]|nr:SDR family oxidoreductase [Actinomycetes bacterium]